MNFKNWGSRFGLFSETISAKKSWIHFSIPFSLVEAIESHGLVLGGGGYHKCEGLITLDQRGSATGDHRHQLASWLSKNQDILEFNVGELRDAWYDSGE